MHQRTDQQALLLIANWDSGTGYAWWLMESYWIALADRYSKGNRVLLAYPSISNIPTGIQNAAITAITQPFGKSLLSECLFLKRNAVRAIYLSDHPNYSLRYLAYRLFGVRLIIVHDHTPGVRSRPGHLKRLVKRLLHQLPGLTADGYIGATDFVRQRLIEVGCAPAQRCHSAPNGLPERTTTFRRGSLKAELGISADTPLAVMTGRANRYKNIGFALKCVAMLSQSGHRLHFLFCGDGPDLDMFQNDARRLGIQGIVTFAGRRNDIPQLLPQCDLALHPSHGEVGYSLSILEYMQAGLPVVVPDNPSVCGATRHRETGMIYQEGNLESMADAIAWLLKDPMAAKAIGKRASEVVLNEYNIKNTHSSLLHAFELIDQDHLLSQDKT